MKSLHGRLAFLLMVLASLIVARPQEPDAEENDLMTEYLVHLDYQLPTERRFDLKKQLEEILGYYYVETIWLAKRPEIFVVAGPEDQMDVVRKLPGVWALVKVDQAIEI